MHGLESKYYDQIAFSYLDIDDPNTAGFKKALGYQYQPHLLLLDANGNVVQQWVGRVTEEELTSAFDAILK